MFFSKRKIKIEEGNSFVHPTIKVKSCNVFCSGKGNKIIFNEGFFCAKRFDVICNGNGNEIYLGKNFSCKNKFHIQIDGNNCKLYLGDNITVVDCLSVYSHAKGNNVSIEVGDDTSFFNTELYCYDNDSSIKIGNDCMFGYNTIVYNTDGHSILQYGKLTNRAGQLTIENHVWVAQNGEILKNSSVGDGSIIGRQAIVSGKFSETNVVLCGIPAKIIKRDICWDRRTVNEVLAGE